MAHADECTCEFCQIQRLGERKRELEIKLGMMQGMFNAAMDRAEKAEAMLPRWIKIEKGSLMPQGDRPVRVIWPNPSPTDRKTARWDGADWYTARMAGIYDEHPDYWLFMPPIPQKPER